MKYLVIRFKVEITDSMGEETNSLMREAACDLLCELAGAAGCESFEVTETGVNAYVQESFFDATALKEQMEGWAMPEVNVTYSVESVEDQDWNATWEEEEGFDPVVVADKLVVYDHRRGRDSIACPLADNALLIAIKAVNAFGTGTHQTTQMVLEELLNANLKDKRVLDCGCGTGILGIAASLLGAKQVWGYDIDEWSSRNALENAWLNGVTNMQVALGDVSVLDQEASWGTEHTPHEADVIVANINRNILQADLPTICPHLAPGGMLVISGFLSCDVEVLKELACKLGLHTAHSNQLDDWCCLTFIK